MKLMDLFVLFLPHIIPESLFLFYAKANKLFSIEFS